MEEKRRKGNKWWSEEIRRIGERKRSISCYRGVSEVRRIWRFIRE